MLKITGGEFKGRPLYAPKTHHVRPTLAKLRAALFNSIQARLPDAKVLDLFSGTGALGLEALSRGASEVVFVEKIKPSLRLLKMNIERLGVEDLCRVLHADVEKVAGALVGKPKFQIILADPPYDDGWEKSIFDCIPFSEVLDADGVFCLETRKTKDVLPDKVGFLVKIREKHYGDSVLSTYLMTKGEKNS